MLADSLQTSFALQGKFSYIEQRTRDPIMAPTGTKLYSYILNQQCINYANSACR